MHPTLIGRTAAPAVAVVGTWDPFLPVHQELCEELVSYARERGLASVAIMLHPSPARFIYGADEAPVYDDIHTRTWQMRRSGVDAVLKIRLCSGDINLGAAEFFDVLTGALDVRELWLGARQSFGRGAPGSQQAIQEQVERRAIKVRILQDPPGGIRFSRRTIEQLLAAGRLAEAIRQVGHAPIWRRPPSRRLRLAWQPGIYEAAPLDDLGASCNGAPLRVTLAAGRAMPVLDWPETRAKYLAFLSGPSDATPVEWPGTPTFAGVAVGAGT